MRIQGGLGNEKNKSFKVRKTSINKFKDGNEHIVMTMRRPKWLEQKGVKIKIDVTGPAEWHVG